jgi:hypothetical protein
MNKRNRATPVAAAGAIRAVSTSRESAVMRFAFCVCRSQLEACEKGLSSAVRARITVQAVS